jgi:hypothetical protein
MISGALVLLFALQTPARDLPARPVGTAVIAGTVVANDAGARPLRKVVVTLGGGGSPVAETAVTDDQGRFVFQNLAAGTYTLTASRPGFVRAAYGEKRPGGTGVPIAILNGQRAAITLKVLHGSAITGSLRTANGQVMQNVDVETRQVQTVNGQRRFVSIGTNWSPDDRGVYRAYGLPPGDYVVAVRIYTSAARQMTPTEIQWAQQAVQPSAAQGAPVASTQGSAVTPAASPELGPSGTYASVYYPGTVDLAEAGLIRLGANEERTSVDVTLQWVRTSKIEGTIIDPDGRPIGNAQVAVTPVSLSGTAPLSSSNFMARPLSDGTFTATGISPGNYVVLARTVPTLPGQQPPGAPRMLNSPSLWAMEPVSVNGEDVRGVTLRLQPGMTMAGKVVFEGTLAPPANLARFIVIVSAVSSAFPAGNGSPMSTSVALEPDGTFTVRGLVPSTYRLSIGAPVATPAEGPYWALRSIVAGRRNVIDVPIEIKPGEDVSGVVATYTDKVTELSGTVIDQAGRPTPDYPIVVFPVDRASWAGSRFIKQVRPASDGKFSLRGLPAGAYYLCAVTDLDAVDLTDLAFLDQLVAGSIKITLGEGEKKNQDVKISG